MDPTSHDDPGWRAAGLDPVSLLLPHLMARRAVSRGGSPLLLLRRLLLTFAVSVVAVGAVAVLLTTTGGITSEAAVIDAPVAAAVVALLGVASLAAQRLVNPPLECERLAKTYRTRFFLHVAFANVPMLLGFTAVVVTGHLWVILPGALLTAVGLWRAAPTRAHLAADQDALIGTGCGRSLLQELLEPA